MLGVVLSFTSLREAADNAESLGEPSSALSVPGTGDGWTTVDTPETRAEVRRVTEGMSQAAGGNALSVVAQFYTHGDVPGASIFFVGINGELDRGLSADESLDDLLRGAYVTDPTTFDPGGVGGALGCGDAAEQGQEWVACVWVGRERAVLLRWQGRSIELAQAAELTRDLRERASR